jgi:hypothetical protein
MKALFTKQSPYSLWGMLAGLMAIVLGSMASMIYQVSQMKIDWTDVWVGLGLIITIPLVIFILAQVIVYLGIFVVVIWRAARWDIWAIIVGSILTVPTLLAGLNLFSSLLFPVTASAQLNDGNNGIIFGSAALVIAAGVIAYNDIRHRRKMVMS